MIFIYFVHPSCHETIQDYVVKINKYVIKIEVAKWVQLH
jgi:hypothetical protein